MNSSETIKLGDYLKKIRIQNNLSQEKFAEQLGIPRSTYANYEANKREPSIEVLNKISLEFGENILNEIFNSGKPSISISETGEITTILDPKKKLEEDFKTFLNSFVIYEALLDNDNTVTLTPHDTIALFNATLSTLRANCKYIQTIPLDVRLNASYPDYADSNKK